MAARQVICARWICCVSLLLCLITTCSAYMKCTDIKHPYRLKQFDASEVPLKPIPGTGLSICQKETTCCTTGMEQKLKAQSRLDYNKALEEATNFIRIAFISRTAKFNEFFTQLLSIAKTDLHDMFVRTYGLLYQQNSQVFKDLFNDLQRYYSGQPVNLVDAQKEFFAELLQKMFVLLNQQYEFDEAYLSCVSKHMDKLKPFGDVPDKLSGQVKRAFIAARTFVQGLAIGRDTVLDVLKIEPTELCEKALMKMTYCPFCSGLPETKPCPKYCLNVMKGCLAQQADLNEAWDAYIKSLMMVADRLEGPFNIESVVDPIDVKISEAIMNFQENSAEVTTKVFAGCGQPRLARKKRQATSGDVNYNFNWKVKEKDIKVRPTTAAGTSLDRLVRDIKEKVNLAKGVWKNLPYAMCTEGKMAMQPEEVEYKNCWNGTNEASYTHDVVNDGFKRQKHNPEVPVNIENKDFIISRAAMQLKAMTAKLKNAYYGLDVDYIDTSDDDRQPMRNGGSGSGDGSENGSGDDGSADGSGYDTDYNPSFNPHIPSFVPKNPKDPSKPDGNPDDDITFPTNSPKADKTTVNPRFGENQGGTGSRVLATVSMVMVPIVTLLLMT